MDDVRLGSAIRTLRHARGWRQADLARRAGVSRSTVWLVESGHAERLAVRTLRHVAATIGLVLAWDPGPAPQLARARDADHASLAELTARGLGAADWDVRPEVSFSRYGERGRIDLLAYHRSARVLLVVEVKTIIVDVQQLLGAMDVKMRLAPGIARTLGWAPRSVVPALVVAEGTTNRRRLAEHGRLFARFALRAWAARQWLRTPSAGVSGILLLERLPMANGRDRRRAGRLRVRLRGAGSSTDRRLGVPATATTAPDRAG